MKLTEQDKMWLRSWGETDKYFPQIERAMQKRYTKYKYRCKEISREEAIALLGRKNYLSGIARSAFHHTAGRDVSDNPLDGVVYFDSRNLFKTED